MSEIIDSIYDDVVKLMQAHAHGRKAGAGTSIAHGLCECTPALPDALAMALVFGSKGDATKIGQDDEAASGERFRW